jgi:hypothetical protein
MDGRSIPNLSLRGLKDPEAVHQAQLVFTNISIHSLFQHQWSPYAVQLDEYGTSITNTRNAMIAAATRDTLKVAYCATCRVKLDSDYYYVGRYAELVTRQDPAIMDALGYPMSKSNTGTKSILQLLPPSSPTLKHGTSGTIIARVDRLHGARSYEGQYTIGDPTVEANWGLHITFGLWHDMVFPNLIPGQLYSFRFRGVFTKGNGPWSAVVTLMAI